MGLQNNAGPFFVAGGFLGGGKLIEWAVFLEFEWNGFSKIYLFFWFFPIFLPFCRKMTTICPFLSKN